METVRREISPPKTCSECDYFLKMKDPQGDCRLHPPVLNIDTQHWEFPQTVATNWCGDGVCTNPPDEVTAARHTRSSERRKGR